MICVHSPAIKRKMPSPLLSFFPPGSASHEISSPASKCIGSYHYSIVLPSPPYKSHAHSHPSCAPSPPSPVPPSMGKNLAFSWVASALASVFCCFPFLNVYVSKNLISILLTHPLQSIRGKGEQEGKSEAIRARMASVALGVVTLIEHACTPD